MLHKLNILKSIVFDLQLQKVELRQWYTLAEPHHLGDHGACDSVFRTTRLTEHDFVQQRFERGKLQQLCFTLTVQSCLGDAVHIFT